MIFKNVNPECQKVCVELIDIMLEFIEETFGVFLSNENNEKALKSLTVVFDETKTPRVESNLIDLKKLIENLDEKYREIKSEDASHIKRIIDMFKYHLDKANSLRISGDNLYDVFHLNDRIKDNEVGSDIYKIKTQLLKTQLSYDVLGSYNHKNKTITIYTDGLNRENFINTFLHEAFHFYHHVFIDDRGVIKIQNRYYEKVVLESLATYAVAKLGGALNDCLLKENPIFYPYSGAKYLTDYKFHEAFEKSLTDFEASLKSFIPTLEAEIILQIEYKDKINKPLAQRKREFYLVNKKFVYIKNYKNQLIIRFNDKVCKRIKSKKLFFLVDEDYISAIYFVKPWCQDQFSNRAGEYIFEGIKIDLDNKLFLGAHFFNDIVNISEDEATSIFEDLLKMNKTSSLDLLKEFLFNSLNSSKKKKGELSIFEFRNKKEVHLDDHFSNSCNFNTSFNLIHYNPIISENNNYIDVTQEIIQKTYGLKSKFTLLYLYDIDRDKEAKKFIKDYGGSLHNKTSSQITILTYFTKQDIDSWRNIYYRKELNGIDCHTSNNSRALVEKLKKMYGVKTLPAIVFIMKEYQNEKYLVFDLKNKLAVDINQRFDEIIKILNENCEEPYKFFKKEFNNLIEGQLDEVMIDTSSLSRCFESLCERKKKKDKRNITYLEIANYLAMTDRYLREKRNGVVSFTKYECIKLAFYFELTLNETNEFLKLNNLRNLENSDEDEIIKKCLTNKMKFEDYVKILRDNKFNNKIKR